jgi:hypothetical protein
MYVLFHVCAYVHIYIYTQLYACYGISCRCGHCKAFTPKFEKAAAYFESKHSEEIFFVKMDGTANEVQSLLVMHHFEEMHAVAHFEFDACKLCHRRLCMGVAQMFVVVFFVCEILGY